MGTYTNSTDPVYQELHFFGRNFYAKYTKTETIPYLYTVHARGWIELLPGDTLPSLYILAGPRSAVGRAPDL